MFDTCFWRRVQMGEACRVSPSRGFAASVGRKSCNFAGTPKKLGLQRPAPLLRLEPHGNVSASMVDVLALDQGSRVVDGRAGQGSLQPGIGHRRVSYQPRKRAINRAATSGASMLTPQTVWIVSDAACTVGNERAACSRDVRRIHATLQPEASRVGGPP